MEPIETKALKPTSSCRLQSRIAAQSAPLWLINPTLPGRAMAFAKVAFSPDSGLMMPRQLGPTTRIPRAFSIIWRSSSTTLFSGLFETSGDDDRTLDPNLCALIDNAGHGLRRRHNDGQVYWLGHIQHTLVGLDAEYMRPPRIHRKHRSSEGSVD